MIRFSLALAALSFSCVALPAIAQEAHPDPRVEEILNKLPSDEKISGMLGEMPDLNVMMDGMIEIAEDEEIRNSLTRAGARLEDQFAGKSYERDNGRPDLNAMMEDVMGITSDRELMGELLGVMFMITDQMEEVMDEAERK